MVENRENNIANQQEKKVSRVTLVLDCDYICHTVLYSLPALSYQGVRTEITLGFLNRLLKFSDQFNPNEIVFAWDSKHSYRKEAYTQYKENRTTKPEEMTPEELEAKKIARSQFSNLRSEILPFLGFENVLMEDGYEADDIIAATVWSNSDRDFVIISSDKDLYQLLSPTCCMFNPSAKKIRTPISFEEEWGIIPGLWAKVKSISGCATDNVAGAQYKNRNGNMTRVGEKRVIKYLKGELGKNTLAYKAIKEAEALGVVDRNKILVQLPLFGTPMPGILKSKVDRHSFIKMCENLGLKSMLNSVTLLKWDNLLSR